MKSLQWACGAEGRSRKAAVGCAVVRHIVPVFRADLGTLAAFARLPGGHRVRTLTPLLMSEAFASNLSTQSQCVRLQKSRGDLPALSRPRTDGRRRRLETP